MIIEILTLFPEMFGPVVGSSMLKRAQERGIAAFRVRNIRDFTTDKHHVADDTPYGGGPGMVLKPEPIAAAIDTVMAENSPTPLTRVYLTPDGEPWTQKLAEEFAQLPGIMLLCGHYEGVDQRIRDHFIDREISIGDYVLTGGEIPAMVVIDSVVRLLPGALGNAESARHDSFSGEGLLDYPHYTRPPVFRGHGIPEVLLSGHHKKIEEWRRRQSLERTLKRRPDIIENVLPQLREEERQFIKELRARLQQDSCDNAETQREP